MELPEVLLVTVHWLQLALLELMEMQWVMDEGLEGEGEMELMVVRGRRSLGWTPPASDIVILLGLSACKLQSHLVSCYS